jgi:predicted nucleic acid-binding protein
MKVFLDTSVMVAAFWGDHKDHNASLRVFTATNRETGTCGIYSLAEVYAKMTALPVRPLLAPEQVFLFVQQTSERLTPVVLEVSDYLQAIRDLSERQFSSSQAYDALLLACARKSCAEIIYTWNVRHFRRIAPDLSERIQTP